MFRVTKKGGEISILLQNDHGLLFRLIRRSTTLRAARKANLLNEVELFFAREHRNNYRNLMTLARFVFKGSEIRFKSWPFGLKFSGTEIFRVIHVKKK